MAARGHTRKASPLTPIAHAVLSNDHKTVTAKIDELLQQLHAEARSTKTSSSETGMAAGTPPPTAAAAARSDSSKRPFADLSQASHQVTATQAASAPAASRVSNPIQFIVMPEEYFANVLLQTMSGMPMA